MFMGTRTILQQAQEPDLTSRAALMPDRVVVINDVSRVRGGATNIAHINAKVLRARGIPVTLITGDDAAVAEIGEQDVEVAAVGSSHILNGSKLAAGLRGLYNYKSKRFLANWISRHDTSRTVYHLHGWSKVLSPSIFRALRPVSSRLVVHAHDFFLVCPNGGYFDFRRGRPCALVPLSAACLACNCDRRSYSHKAWRAARQRLLRAFFDPDSGAQVLAVHEGMIPLLEYGGLARNQLRVLRNPAQPWRTERVSAEHNRAFIFVGRLDGDKGVDLVAKAARQAGVPLIVIGSGPLAAVLARDFPEVGLVGWKSREEISELCRDARALVLPTRSRETFGLVALEALISGLPVIISTNAMLAAEIAAAGFGFSCDPNETVMLADMLRGLADDDKLVSSMSRKAHIEARQLAPTVAEWTDGLLACYGSLLQSAAHRI